MRAYCSEVYQKLPLFDDRWRAAPRARAGREGMQQCAWGAHSAPNLDRATTSPTFFTPPQINLYTT